MSSTRFVQKQFRESEPNKAVVDLKIMWAEGPGLVCLIVGLSGSWVEQKEVA